MTLNQNDNWTRRNILRAAAIGAGTMILRQNGGAAGIANPLDNNPTPNEKNTIIPSTIQDRAPPSLRATILFGGDTLLGGYYASPQYGTRADLTQFIDDQITKCGIDGAVERMFSGIYAQIKSADYAVLNLEGPITQRLPTSAIERKMRRKTFPLRQHEAAADIIHRAGFNMVSLANNHMFDYNGREGIESTLAALDGKLTHIGAGNGDDAYNANIKSINGITVAFCALNTICGADEQPRSGTISIASSRGDSHAPPQAMERLRYVAKQADFAIAYIHMGPLKGDTLLPSQRVLAEMYLDNGASIVIGSHSHKKQAIREFDDKGSKKIAFYGIGNLLFGAYCGVQDISMLPKITLTKCGDKKSIAYDTNDMFPNPERSWRPRLRGNA